MDTTEQLLAPPRPAFKASDIAIYLLLGLVFGVILTKTEVISWFRIQEMFRFQSFHMYGVIGSAVAVAALSVLLIKRLGLKTITGEAIVIEDKPYDHGYNHWIGGILFGLGWALTGACPGPLYALIGNGVSVILVALLSAAGGAWAYGALKSSLPH